MKKNRILKTLFYLSSKTDEPVEIALPTGGSHVDDPELMEHKAEKLDINNTKYVLLSFISCFIVGGFAMRLAETLGLDIKLWWPPFVSVPLAAAMWIAAIFAMKRFHKFEFTLKRSSEGLRRSHYIAVRAINVARCFVWFPVLTCLSPFALLVFHVKMSAFVSICLAVILTWAGRVGDRIALSETGYTPKKTVRQNHTSDD